MSLSPKLEQTLKAIHDGNVAHGIHYANPNSPMVAVLVNGGHAATDNNRIDPADGRKIAVTVTPSGLAELGIAPVSAAPVAVVETQTQEDTMEAATAPAEAVKRTRKSVNPVVQIGGFSAMPTSSTRRGGNRKEVYAFGQLEAPPGNGTFHSFFVPVTAENPDPLNSLRAATSSANARYKDKTGAKFKHFAVTENDVAGVRVFRVE